MTSRERIVETLNHREPDRVAIDLGATNATGISAIVYNKLKKLLGIAGGQIKVIDIMQQLAEVEPEVLERIGGDVVMLRKYAMTMGIPFKGFKPGKLTDGADCMQAETYDPKPNEKGEPAFYKITDGSDRLHPFPLNGASKEFDKGKIVAKLPKGAHAYVRVYHPLSGVDSVEEFEKFGFPETDAEELEFLKCEAHRLYMGTDKAVCGIFQGNVFELGQIYWGYQKFFEFLLTEPEMMLHYFKKRTAAIMRDLEKYLGAVGEYIHIINFCDDLGTQSSLLVSPGLYRSMIKPFHAEMFGFVKKNYPHIKVFFHSCGAICDLIPDFIEIGADILNPVQFTAAGMDPAKLKKQFGKQLVFWGGGVDTQSVLNGKSEKEVRKMAGEMLDIFAPGGGYVFSQVHNIESCVPAENVLAAFETAKNYKRGQ
jgi:uroporphyrinogen decarboxylase